MEPGGGEIPAIEPIDVSGAISEATFIPGRVFPDAPSISVGRFAAPKRELIDRTMQGPDYGERARVIFSDQSGALTFGEVVEGEEMFLEYDPDFFVTSSDPQVPRRKRQGRFNAMAMHSHNEESIPSPSDLVVILVRDEEPDAATSICVVTPESTYMIFRGKNTPQMTAAEAEGFAGREDMELKKLLDAAVFLANPDFKGSLNPVEQERYRKIAARNSEQYLRFIAKELDLKVYKGGLDDDVLVKL